VEDVAAFGERLHLRLRARAVSGASAGPQDALDRLRASLTAAGVRVDELAAIPPSLEDVFIALTEGVLLAGETERHGDGETARHGDGEIGEAHRG
jgi:hypothetical protein